MRWVAVPWQAWVAAVLFLLPLFLLLVYVLVLAWWLDVLSGRLLLNGVGFLAGFCVISVFWLAHELRRRFFRA
ncbi:MAG: hypothetical protein HY917_00510 [Candidatus Diapherotrites archaeon]|nr:hypothetical protein [Candidatus Diapherotrites archaeon]